MNLKRKIEEIVGGPYRFALFYNFANGLRFELSEDGSPLDQVLTALRKATVICDDVFGKEEKILVHLQAFAPASQFGLRNMIRELHVAGIVIPEARDVWIKAEDQTHAEDGDESRYWVNCAFEVPRAKLQNLLWCAVTTDFGPSLRPNPHCRVYLINTNQGIVAHPYDDRGMDVISRSTSVLVGLYEKHNDLLLDYDREAMSQTFIRS
ncbi:DUF3885 domain-containing protein [Duganella sp. HH101]|uniref:DUF3885 domain-containing protein n=1 Tax=Duganella sp. HH101 TaxID=1781066 RepID=UPI00087543D2|nr:DUF3885 domain-containing protein [Duganella sp. HH101]OFA04252.1 hypothetical protein DUGA2_25240 [Duganella sp. HH101]